MSKNIESIVEKLNRYYRNLPPHAKSREGGVLIKEVLEALTEKKLCVPMSELEIFINLKNTYFDNSLMTGDQLWVKLAKAIYEAQFGGNK